MELVGEMDPSMPLARKIEAIMRSAAERMSLTGLKERPGMEQHELADIRAAVMAEVNEGNIAEFAEPGARTLYQWTGPLVREIGKASVLVADDVTILAVFAEHPVNSMAELIKATALDELRVRDGVKRLTHAGRLRTMGHGRGTKYLKPLPPLAPVGPSGAAPAERPAGSNGATSAGVMRLVAVDSHTLQRVQERTQIDKELTELGSKMGRKPHLVERPELKLDTLKQLGKLVGPNIRDLLDEIGRDLSACAS